MILKLGESFISKAALISLQLSGVDRSYCLFGLRTLFSGKQKQIKRKGKWKKEQTPEANKQTINHAEEKNPVYYIFCRLKIFAYLYHLKVIRRRNGIGGIKQQQWPHKKALSKVWCHIFNGESPNNAYFYYKEVKTLFWPKHLRFH